MVRHWSRRAAAAALLLVTGCGAAPAPGSPTDAGTVAVTAPATPASSPPGLRPVTFHGLTVDVPTDWSTDGTRCGTPIEPTVVLVHFSAPACGISSSMVVPSLQLFPLPPDEFAGLAGAPDTGPWTEVTVAGLPARRQDTRSDGSARTTVQFPEHRAQFTLTAGDEAGIAAVLDTLRPDTLDAVGCPVAVAPDTVVGSGEPPTRDGATDTVFPDGVRTLRLCSYGDGLLEYGALLTDDARTALLDAVAAAPAGLSTTDPATFLPELCTDRAEWVDNRDLYRLTATYPAGPDVDATARLALCLPSGIGNGAVTRQVTGAFQEALMRAAHRDGAPGGWVPVG